MKNKSSDERERRKLDENNEAHTNWAFYKKCDNSIDKNKNRHSHGGLSEDFDIGNSEHEEELIKSRREEIRNNILHEADHKKVIKNIIKSN